MFLFLLHVFYGKYVGRCSSQFRVRQCINWINYIVLHCIISKPDGWWESWISSKAPPACMPQTKSNVCFLLYIKNHGTNETDFWKDKQFGILCWQWNKTLSISELMQWSQIFCYSFLPFGLFFLLPCTDVEMLFLCDISHDSMKSKICEIPVRSVNRVLIGCLWTKSGWWSEFHGPSWS